MDFEWDERKAAENLVKHGISFADAIKIFLDPHRMEQERVHEASREVRMKVVGAVESRVSVVIYTVRQKRYRIISARKASRRERRIYQTHPPTS